MMLSLPARLLGLAHDLEPGAMVALLGAVNRVVPSGSARKSSARRGEEVRDSLRPRRLDRRLERAARAANQLE